MLGKIKELAQAQASDLTEFRHYLHSRPELSWQEVGTTRDIAAKLADLGIEYIKTGFGGTECGIVAEINPGKKGSTVALRADIDALPLSEENDLPYRSVREGVMHACGHDAHATMLLGAARILSAIKNELPGTVRFIFQPAEEHGVKSGAETMIKEGALEGVDAIAGLHIWSPFPSGKAGFRGGAIMASADIWEITVSGQGGHGSAPQNAVDPTVAAATVITTMQTVISREVDPQDTAVLSIGRISSGTAPNIIPESATMVGNIRTTNPETRSVIPEKMERIMNGICSAFRCSGTLKITNIYPVTVNDKALTELARRTAMEMLGEDWVIEAPLQMGSEDFSYYGEKVPGTFFLLGCGNKEKGTDNQHHSPRFNVDDDVLPTGAALLAGFAWKFLSDNGK